MFATGGRVLCAAVLLGAVSCRQEPVRLAAILPLTGPQAAYGESLERGILLGAEEVNAAGGVGGLRLDVALEDSRSDPDRAVRLLESWSGPGRVRAVIGGATSEEALALAARAEPLGVLVLSPSASSPALSGASRYFFRNWPSDAAEAEAAAEFAAYSLHATRVEVLAEDNAYGRGLAEAFQRAFEGDGRRAGLSISVPGQVPPPAQGPPGAVFQAIYLAGYSGALLPVAEGLRRAGDRRPILACSAFARSDLLREAPPWMEGVCLLGPGPVSADGGTEKAEFASRFTARWGEAPDVYASHAYDAVRILGAALAASPGGDAEALRSALLSLKGFSGAAGPTSFTELGDARRAIGVWVFDGGRPRPLKAVSDRVLPPLQDEVARLRLKGA